VRGTYEGVYVCCIRGKAMSYKNPGICLFPFQILIYDSSFINYVCCGEGGCTHTQPVVCAQT
jgi:hypothetical protein